MRINRAVVVIALSVIAAIVLNAGVSVVAFSGESTNSEFRRVRDIATRAFSGLPADSSKSRDAAPASAQAAMSDTLIWIDSSRTSRPAYAVSLGARRLVLSKWRSDTTEIIKHYTVFLDSTGTIPIAVIGVSLRDTVTPIQRTKLYDPQRADADYFIKYNTAPAVPPRLSLVDALKAHLFGSPLLAHTIIAHYELYTCGGVSNRPAWMIEFHGLPPMMVNERRAGFTDWYTVVDAADGKLLFTASVPCEGHIR